MFVCCSWRIGLCFQEGMMELEHKVYDTSMEVKEIVMAVEQFRCRKYLVEKNWPQPSGPIIPPEYYDFAKEAAKGTLLCFIEIYIKYHQNEYERYIEAEIYVRALFDEKIKNLESAIACADREIVYLMSLSTKKTRYIDWLEQPWWKKIFREYKDG